MRQVEKRDPQHAPLRTEGGRGADFEAVEVISSYPGLGS